MLALLIPLVWLGACGPAEGVEVEPLPPLERPSPEARAGLPTITGTWRFAGWEVARAELAAAANRAPGDLILHTQRIDSLAGRLVQGESWQPLVGEIRRDGVVSFASMPADTAAPAARRFAAGRVRNDTLWLELATLPTGELSPAAVRWAFVRRPVGQPFLRLPGGELLRDTIVAEPDPLPPAARPPADPSPPDRPPEDRPPPDRPAEEPARPPAEPPAEPAAPREPRVAPPPQAPPPDTLRDLPPPDAAIDIPPAAG